jgi:hypothetical protein
VDADVMLQPDSEAGITTWEARFTSTATVETDLLKVTIDGYDRGEHDFGPVIWNPHPGPMYPAEGDLALVTQSDAGRWWVLRWIPAEVAESFGEGMMMVSDGPPDDSMPADGPVLDLSSGDVYVPG